MEPYKYKILTVITNTDKNHKETIRLKNDIYFTDRKEALKKLSTLKNEFTTTNKFTTPKTEIQYYFVELFTPTQLERELK